MVDGMISLPSIGTYRETVDRLELALREREIAPFLRFDHAAAAHEVGLSLKPLMLVVFGDPKVGTAVMQDTPTAGIDLPLKLIVWEASDGEIRIGYNDPAWIFARHSVARTPGRIALLLEELAFSASGRSVS